MDKELIEQLVREVLTEKLNKADTNGVLKVPLPNLEVTEEDRLDTGNAKDKVYCKDLFTLEQSGRLGCGLMVMDQTTFNWHLDYDEIDYIIEGTLKIIVNGNTVTANEGEVILIPKGSDIQFSVADKARFVYVTYPADWNKE